MRPSPLYSDTTTDQNKNKQVWPEATTHVHKPHKAEGSCTSDCKPLPDPQNPIGDIEHLCGMSYNQNCPDSQGLNPDMFKAATPQLTGSGFSEIILLCKLVAPSHCNGQRLGSKSNKA